MDIMMDKFRAETRWVRLGDIQFDERYQRVNAMNRKSINDIAKNFNVAAVGTLDLSQREDGSLWCMDGMHRWHGMVKRFGLDTMARCVVYHGMTLQDEALRFWMQTKRTNIGQVHQFSGRLLSGDEKAISLVALLESVGLEAATNGGQTERKFKAISTAEQMIKAYGVDGFMRILRIACGIRADNGRAPDIVLLKAVEQLLLRFDLDDARLTSVIATLDWNVFRQRVWNMARLGTAPGWDIAAMALHAEYNKGRRNRLADFASTPKRKTIAPATN